MHPAVEQWTRRRKRNHQWEHSLHRYVTIGRRADHLRAVWDAARGQRVSRWLTPPNAERVRADCEQGWRTGQVVWLGGEDRPYPASGSAYSAIRNIASGAKRAVSLTADNALSMMNDRLTPDQLAALMPLIRQAMRDKSYQDLPMGEEAARYLRSKRKRLTDSSYRGYEGCLDKLARHFPDLELQDFELPLGAERIEEFLDERWGAGNPGTYNVNLSILSDFFKWQVKRGRMHSKGAPFCVFHTPSGGRTTHSLRIDHG